MKAWTFEPLFGKNLLFTLYAESPVTKRDIQSRGNGSSLALCGVGRAVGAKMGYATYFFLARVLKRPGAALSTPQGGIVAGGCVSRKILRSSPRGPMARDELLFRCERTTGRQKDCRFFQC